VIDPPLAEGVVPSPPIILRRSEDPAADGRPGKTAPAIFQKAGGKGCRGKARR
jgi:hypothetical protein